MGQDGKKNEEENEQSNQGNNRIISEDAAKNALLNTPIENIKNEKEVSTNPLDKGLGVVTPRTVSEKQEIQRLADETAAFVRESIKKDNSIELKYVPIVPESIPSKFMFYEDGREVDIRPSSLEEMIAYSMMNVEDSFDINDKVNEIMDACCKVRMGRNIRGIYATGQTGSFKDIVQYDKVCMLFSMRDLSMAAHQRENKIFQTVTNPKNGDKRKVEITKDIFDYHELKEWMTKLYNPELKCFTLNSDKFSQPINIFVPTIGTVDYVTKYLKEVRQMLTSGKNIFVDHEFLKLFQFMVPDWRLLDKEHSYYEEKRKWWHNSANYDEKMTIIKFIDKLELGITNRLTVKFGESEVREPIYFPSYKSIFDLSSSASDLIPDTE